MNTYIALFRGINVGGNNLLPMKELKSLLQDNGFDNVRTYIQSGNVVYQSDAPRGDIVSQLLELKFGFQPKVIIFSLSEFRAIANASPYFVEEGKASHFYFSDDSIVANLEKIETFRAESEQVVIQDKVLYLFAPNGIGRSKLVSNLESCLASAVTGRNLSTVRKLLEIAKD